MTVFVREEEELPRVMREITDALDGRGAVLTMHPTDEVAPQVIYADETAGISKQLIESLLAAGELAPGRTPEDTHVWVECQLDAQCRHAISIPVQRVAMHSRLVITVFFDGLTESRRAAAQAVYLARRPFAVGYFRLWQVNRTHVRHRLALEAALNLTDFGVILLSRSGTLLFVNHGAQATLDRNEGLQETRHQLRATNRVDAVRLQTALEHVLRSCDDPASLGEAPMLSLERSDKLPLVVSVQPAPEPAVDEGDIAAIVFVVDPAIEVGHLLEPVCQMFHLSTVESQLVRLLVSGRVLAEAAKIMNVKTMTARGYLRSVFIKTATNRQTDLMRLMLSSLVHTTRSIPAATISRYSRRMGEVAPQPAPRRRSASS